MPGKLDCSKTVLLVEDLDDLREILRDFLESRGLTVLEASNAAEGIRIAASHPCVIDLLLTDIEMPDMSGWKAAEAIAASKPGIRIVYVSAGCDEE